MDGSSATFGNSSDIQRADTKQHRRLAARQTNRLLHRRGLRVEQLEDRMLLSISGISSLQPASFIGPIPAPTDTSVTTASMRSITDAWLEWKQDGLGKQSSSALIGPVLPPSDQETPSAATVLNDVADNNVILAEATIAAPLNSLTPVTATDTVVYSQTTTSGYASATGGIIGYDDYDSTNNDYINLKTFKFAGGVTAANGVLTFKFYSDRGRTTLFAAINITVSSSGDYVYTIPLSNFATIPDAGVVEISAASGTTGHWYYGSSAPTTGSNDASYGSINYGYIVLSDNSGAADLTPYQPSGWSEKIVVSNKTGTNTNDTLYTTDTLYVDWSIVNSGAGGVTSAFTTSLYIDDAYAMGWTWGGAPPAMNYGAYLSPTDYCLGTLKAGTHTLRIVADSSGTVSESDETNNTYTKTFTVLQTNTKPVIRGLSDIELNEDEDYLGTSGTTEASTKAAALNVTESYANMVPIGFDGDIIVEKTIQTVHSASDDSSIDIVPLTDSTPSGTRYLVFDDWGGTWLDAEKDSQAGDDLMCWAASASNGLVWSEWGLTAGMSNTDQIFQYFQDHWTDLGGLAQFGWEWWFDGVNVMQGVADWSQVDAAGGNFYPTYDPNVYIHSRGQGATANQYTMSDINQYLHAGYGVGLGLFGTIGHAITVWGFNYDSSLSPSDRNYYKGIWISDSDDNKIVADGNAAPDVLHYYAVTWDSTNLRYNFDSYRSGSYIGEVDGLEIKPANTTDLWTYTKDGETSDSGLTFSIIGNTNPNAGVTIASNRYLQVNPVANWSGTSDITIQVSDPQGLTSTATFRVTVNAVNDAPVLDDTGDMSLTSITEDDTSNAGDQISTILASAGGDRITDADSGAVEGIAVIAATHTGSGAGHWEYYANGWVDVGVVSESSALLLQSSDTLRFCPDSESGEIGTITFCAWDQTGATAGQKGTKVDVSSRGGSTPFSLATETASITVTSVDYYDFGDAPAVTYQTLLANDGARHVIGGPRLGATVDAEEDGQPTTNADGDDTNGDDEDGVVFTTLLRSGTTAGVDVTASAAGLLSAWVDFNRDGDWADAGEQIFTDRALAVGQNSLTFAVPGGTATNAGASYARFRISTAGGLSCTGLAADGEVEDYQVQLYSRVADRHIVYNNSGWDAHDEYSTGDPAANQWDDNAIATDKAALLPGGSASFANYTSYLKGINEIMIDIAGLAATPTAADFQFKIGNSTTPDSWSTAPAPTSITIREGAGVDGSDRVSITWNANDIQNEWLQVVVLAANTGLPTTGGSNIGDTHYWGNQIGETGNASGSTKVDAGDVTAVRNSYTLLGTALITNPYDVNRDRKVNAGDYTAVRSSYTLLNPTLRLFTAPTGSSGTVDAEVVQLSAISSLLGVGATSSATGSSLDALYAESDTATPESKTPNRVDATIPAASKRLAAAVAACFETFDDAETESNLLLEDTLTEDLLPNLLAKAY